MRRRRFAVLLGLLCATSAAAGAADGAEGSDEVRAVLAHMHDDPVHAWLLADRLEWQNGGSSPDVLHWKLRGWVGRDFSRLWLRAEGERPEGRAGHQSVEVLRGRAVAPWWDLLLGIRQELGTGPDRSFFAAGLAGVAPLGIEVEATAYAGESGQAGVALDLEYELLLTNRLILAPEVEAAAWRRDDAAAGRGSGLDAVTAGLRLRYEIRRELAPYLGLEWQGRFGDGAGLAKANGEPARDTRVVIGLRAWF